MRIGPMLHNSKCNRQIGPQNLLDKWVQLLLNGVDHPTGIDVVCVDYRMLLTPVKIAGIGKSNSASIF